MTRIILLTIAAMAAPQVHAFMTLEQVEKEFKEPGHIPQGLKISPYQKLDKVIPKWAQSHIKEERKKLKMKSSSLAAAELPEQVDLRKYDSPIREQWNGSCTANALVAGMENIINRSEKSFLSARYFWSLYRQYSVYSAIDSATRSKQIDDKYWPQHSSKAKASKLSSYGKYKLAQQAFLDADGEAVIQALAKGYPVYVGMAVPSDMAACRSTIRYSSAITDGGHALAVVGYAKANVPGGYYLILKNSWGTECADQGYQYMPLGLCEKDGMYCVFWSLEKVAK
jgi:C1A family cysteine protease